jgi:hypothetical protein
LLVLLLVPVLEFQWLAYDQVTGPERREINVIFVQSSSIFGEFFAKYGWRQGGALLASAATTFYEKN